MEEASPSRWEIERAIRPRVENFVREFRAEQARIGRELGAWYQSFRERKPLDGWQSEFDALLQKFDREGLKVSDESRQAWIDFLNRENHETKLTALPKASAGADTICVAKIPGHVSALVPSAEAHGDEGALAQAGLGPAPGRRYNSADDAARQAIRDVRGATKRNRREYGGAIYWRDGSYSYTDPEEGPPSTGERSFCKVPVNVAGQVATYHTHTFSNLHSPADKILHDKLGMPSYLGTPDGKLQKYTPKANSKQNPIGRGTVTELPP